MNSMIGRRKTRLLWREDIPFENVLMFSKLSPLPVLSSGLTIPELTKLIGATDWDIESVTFTGLTYGQAMVLYKQWAQENPYHTPLEIPTQLLHVVPAHTIQAMYHYHLILRKTTLFSNPKRCYKVKCLLFMRD